MNSESLLASVGINIGLAMVILFLFSILKKQPSNAAIYYPRPLSKRHPITFPPFSLRRFIPSFSWIPRAFRVTEDEILQTNGLDALIVIRLFKFGINFFTVCSSVGLLILLPINFGGQPASSDSYRSMDSCTISNIKTGSNMLWVHFMCLWFISLYGLHLLYREYSEILVKRIQQVRNLRHRPDQFTTLVREIPVCGEHQARGCCVDHFFSKYHPYSYHSYKMLYDGKNIEDLSKQARYVHEKVQGLRKKCEGKKHGKESDECRDDLLKITGLEEKLEELCRKIRQLQSEDMLKGKELPVAFVTFKSRWGAAMAAQTQQHTNPLLWITEMAPEPSDVSWRNLSIQYKILPVYKIGVILAATLLTIFFAVPVTAVQGIAKFEKLKKWFPPAMAIEFIPGLSSVVTGYLPSAVLKGFIYIVPFAMLGMAKLGGSISKSKEEIKACNMVFYFLLGNVFFLSLISGSLLDEIGEYVSHPKNFPSHLAALVSSQADFFMTYILTEGLSGFSLEVLQPGLLIWDFIKSRTYCRGKEKDLYLYSLQYFRIIPIVSLSILIGIVYAVIAPLLLPFLIVYFFLGYAVYINQIQDVYETVYDTCGTFWPFIHHYIIVAIILMQITMIGLFGLKSKPAASVSTIPLLLLTIMFNEYCKIRFLPAFRSHSIQNAVENDEFDEKSSEVEHSFDKAIEEYLQPCLVPVSFTQSDSSLYQPLITSW
ncbi:CSC1-like protein At3g54510 isoform X1 [Gossypium hirsutum]|uniref:CSC1-like protein At3g54510 isoform X1 n=2 Tax=Gossypium hirsutum TaxID=3635 RepID=A0A1U8JD99_GOSHI|nr:CSC1-like protein At3g54510 isoform X1 [Gossypium hirsutum]